MSCYPQAHARTLIIEEFDPGFFQDGGDSPKRFRSCDNGTVKVFHLLERAERHFRFSAQFALCPAQEGTRRADVSAGNRRQITTLPRACC